MQIIVVSDTHRHTSALREVFARHSDADMFIHLGDGSAEFELLREQYPLIAAKNVRGNCDFAGGAPDYQVISCGIAKLFFTHGHLYQVKHSLDRLLEAARRATANVALYGHTHAAYCGYLDGVHLMNPGSLGEPRGCAASYGVIDVTEKEIVCRIVPLQLLRFC